MIGTRIAHYEITAKLGEGGMGVVYQAHDTHLDRFVAIKVLPAEKVADPERKRRFVQEAKSASALNHPNIVIVHDIANESGVDFIVMEYVAGKTLDVLIPRDGMSLSKVLKIATQVAGALTAAHEAGIVHRDLKPGNIMVDDDGRVRVLDFGIAKLVEKPVGEFDETVAPAEATAADEILGTPAYMSPEQVERRKLDTRSDIFSFGVLLHEMLTGRKAFQRRSAIAIMAAILREEPSPLRDSASDVPPELETILSRCLRKNADERFQRSADLKTALEGLQRSGPDGSESLPSIAVLPFLNMNRDEESEFFCDGLTEELINALTQLSGLRVVSRTSVFHYKGVAEDICAVGKKLRVTTVLEGSVRRAGNRLRITAQLINVADGYHLWSQRFDREMKDVFDVQDELARSIVEILKVKLTGGETEALVKRATENIEAYELYVKGLYYYRQWSRQGLEKGISCFEQAQALDPGYAQAFASAGFARFVMATTCAAAPRDVIPTAKSGALTALKIDNSIAEAHVTLGSVLDMYEWDWRQGEQELKRAVELNPSDSHSHLWYCHHLTLVGRFDEAISEGHMALRLDPLYNVAHFIHAFCLIMARRYDECIEHCRNAMDLYPDYAPVLWMLGQAQALKGDHANAVAVLETGLRLHFDGPLSRAYLGWAYGISGRRRDAERMLARALDSPEATYRSPVCIAWIHLGLGDKGEALHWLEKACEEPDGLLSAIKFWPVFDPLRGEPRFHALLGKLNLAE